LRNGERCTNFDFTSEKPILKGWEKVGKNTVYNYESSALPLSYSDGKRAETCRFPRENPIKFSGPCL
jgi:hypothetical protein